MTALPARQTTTDTDTAAARQPGLGLAAAAAAAAAWGIAGVFVKLATVPPLELTLYRLVLASGLMLTALLAARRRPHWRDLVAAVPGGVLLCGDMACYFSAVKLTSVADASVIGALQPAAVMLAAGRLFGEEVTKRDVAWTTVALGGVATVVLGTGIPGGHHLLGDVFAVVSMAFWTVYFLVSKRARRHTGAVEYTFGVTVVAAVVLVPVVLVAGEPVAGIDARSWLWVVLLAVVPGGGHLLINWAHRSVDVSVSSVIGASNPVFAAAAAWVVLHQSLNLLQLAGGVLGIVGICVVAGRKRLPPTSAVDPDAGLA